LEIIWSEFAEKQLDDIFEYHEENATTRVAKKMVRNLINEPERLRKDPSIGQKEELLSERKIPYRYLIFKHYKIIYSVDEEYGFVKIADVFNTFQNPTRIERID